MVPNPRRLPRQVCCNGWRCNTLNQYSRWRIFSPVSKCKRHNSTKSVSSQYARQMKFLAFTTLNGKCYKYNICSFCPSIDLRFEFLKIRTRPTWYLRRYCRITNQRMLCKPYRSWNARFRMLTLLIQLHLIRKAALNIRTLSRTFMTHLPQRKRLSCNYWM